MQQIRIDEIIRREVIPAMGCTEPAAAALAGAKAAELLGAVPTRAQVYASRNMIKNAMGVSIPNSSLHGIHAAVSLGLAMHDSSSGLALLNGVTDVERGIASGIDMNVEILDNVPSLYIKVIAFSDDHQASAEIANEHDRFSSLEIDGKVLSSNPLFFPECQSFSKEDVLLSAMDFDDIVNYARRLSPEMKALFRNAMEMNMEISYAGVTEDWGLNAGRIMFKATGAPRTVDDAMRKGAALAAAGSDARMSGSCRPVMINSGSGNQGITVTVPVTVLGRFLNADEDRIIEAIAISELTGLVLTSRKDRLSALCGAFTAAIGTACAYVFLLGGGTKEMDAAVNNMVGNLSGIICDGAKKTCALKIYSSLVASSLAVHLAMEGFKADSGSGILGDDSLESITYLSRLTHEGMKETDRTILDIMLEKDNRNA